MDNEDLEKLNAIAARLRESYEGGEIDRANDDGMWKFRVSLPPERSLWYRFTEEFIEDSDVEHVLGCCDRATALLRESPGCTVAEISRPANVWVVLPPPTRA